MMRKDGWFDPDVYPAPCRVDLQIVIWDEAEGWYVEQGFMNCERVWFLTGQDFPLAQTPRFYRPLADLPAECAEQNAARVYRARQRTEWPVDGDGAPIDRERVAPEVYPCQP